MGTDVPYALILLGVQKEDVIEVWVVVLPTGKEVVRAVEQGAPRLDNVSSPPSIGSVRRVLGESLSEAGTVCCPEMVIFVRFLSPCLNRICG